MGEDCDSQPRSFLPSQPLQVSGCLGSFEMSGGGGGGVSPVVRLFAKVTATLLGGSLALGFLTSSVAQYTSSSIKKKRKVRLCRRCKGVGYYACKLCKGNGTIDWSFLYDPVLINPCVCPTCEGSKVQRCLNCLGDGTVF